MRGVFVNLSAQNFDINTYKSSVWRTDFLMPQQAIRQDSRKNLSNLIVSYVYYIIINSN